MEVNAEQIPSEILVEADEAVLGLIPSKSKDRYETEFSSWEVWMKEKKVAVINETVLLAYFSEKSKIYQCSSLWAKYSMIKKMLLIKKNVDISKYCKLVSFLKSKSSGHEPKKAKVLSKENVIKFMTEAPDDMYLLTKVALIFGIYGALRREEQANISVNDIEDDSGADITSIKRHGGWRSTSVAEGYLEDSIEAKNKISRSLLGVEDKTMDKAGPSTDYSEIVWLADWWAGMKLIVYMDHNDYEKYVGKNHCVVIMNRTYEIDWLLAAVLSDRMHLLGSTKAYLKKFLQYIPVLGWAWKFSEFIFLERSFEKDKEIIAKQVKELTTYPDPVALLLYPEGTRFTPKKHRVSEEFARIKNLPKLKHHLYPRTCGFITSILTMNDKAPEIYDIILAFRKDDPIKPTMLNVILGESITAYLYIKRIPMEDLPTSEDELKKYCEDIFVRKDKLKESFIQTGDFFATSGVPRTAQLVLNRRVYSLINMIIWAIAILCPMIYYLIALLFSGKSLYFGLGVSIIASWMGLLYMAISMTKSYKGSTYGGATSKSSHQ